MSSQKPDEEHEELVVTLTEDDQGEHHTGDGPEHAATDTGLKADQPTEAVMESAASAGSYGSEKTTENASADTGAIVSVVLKEEPSGDQVPSFDMPIVTGSNSQPGQSDAPSSMKEGGDHPKPDLDHLPEPPASPTSNTAFSGSATSTATSAMPDLPAKPVTSTERLPSSNRLSVAYAQGTRRLLVDADVVEKMILFRAEGRIEIDIVVEPIDDGFKGILVLHSVFAWFRLLFNTLLFPL